MAGVPRRLRPLLLTALVCCLLLYYSTDLFPSPLSFEPTFIDGSCNQINYNKWRNLFFSQTVEEWQQTISTEEIAQKRALWQDYVENALSWDSVKNRFRGRGIVITAGNGKMAKHP
jgi:hypothetical protein